MTFVLGSSEAKDLAAAEGTNAQEDTPARRSEANDTVGGNTEGDDNEGNKEDDNPSLLSGKKGSRSICKKSPPKLTVRECYKLTNKGLLLLKQNATGKNHCLNPRRSRLGHLHQLRSGLSNRQERELHHEVRPLEVVPPRTLVW
jgi:hypothetical protein